MVLYIFVKKNGLSEKYGLCKSSIPASKMLFKAMINDGVKSAIIVSSVTFGIGHIVNLINGSGAELLENILQVLYAVAIGFILVMIFYKTKSMIVCIAMHSIFNSLSAFVNEAAITNQRSIIRAMFLIIVSGGYALYIVLKVKDTEVK